MSLIQFEIRKKALIIGFHHPFNAIQIMAERISGALSGLGYEVRIAMVGTQDLANQLSFLDKSDLEMIVFLGSPPMGIKINDKYLWEFLPQEVRFLGMILDSLPYDFRMQGFSDYLQFFSKKSNGYLTSFEGNIARTLSDLTDKEVFHLHHGSYEVTQKVTEEKKFPERLMFWGSIAAELGRNESTNDLFYTIQKFNVWGLSTKQISILTEKMKAETDFYSFCALSKFLEISYRDLLRQDWIQALCAIDSALKRYRRLFLIESIQDFPLDIYGKNWEQFLKPSKNVRLMQFEPDDNAVFSYACRDYGAVVNIDPNWGNGTNERAITSLAQGINLVSNQNLMIEGTVGSFLYNLNKDSIRSSCELALRFKNPQNPLTKFTWAYVISDLIKKIY